MDVIRIKDFFFEAMRNGWASEKPQPVFLFLPGQKTYEYKREDLYLRDSFFVVHGSKFSYGTTVIWVADRPSWVMHYGGWYDKGVIPFLKRTLVRNYNENVFIGGRGPKSLEGEDHTIQYINNVEYNDFNGFKGYEWIEATSPHSGVSAGTKLGEHHYFGGLFI